MACCVSGVERLLCLSGATVSLFRGKRILTVTLSFFHCLVGLICGNRVEQRNISPVIAGKKGSKFVFHHVFVEEIRRDNEIIQIVIVQAKSF